MTAFTNKTPVTRVIGVLRTAGILTACGILAAGCEQDSRYFTKPQFSCNDGDHFCNVTGEAGLDDVARLGKGAAMVDVNNDGWVDMFLSDADARLEDEYGVSAFYINNKDGTFTRASLGIDESDLISNWLGSFADYDRDGDQDLVLLNGGYAGESNLAFYENQPLADGTPNFVRRSSEVGFDYENRRPFPWWGVSWADFNNDGYPDFAVQARRGAYFLFRNNGDRTFTNIAESAGIQTNVPWGRDGKNIVWIDYDGDGDQDLYYAGIFGHGFFANNGDETFTNVTDQVFSTPFPENRNYKKGAPVVFAAAAIDFNQDGYEDLYLGRQAEQDLILLNDGRGRFTQHNDDFGLDDIQTGPNEPNQPFENTMGMGVGDLQDDGYPDILLGTGSPERAAEDILYCNQQGKGVKRCTELINGNADGTHWSRTHGTLFGDVNNDGRTDLWINQGGHAPWDKETGISSREIGSLFLRQEGSKLGDFNTATITLQGTESNPDGFGAKITVDGSETHYYWKKSSQAFQSQNSPHQVVTLGSAERGIVRVDWPSGKVSEIIVRPGERHTIVEYSD